MSRIAKNPVQIPKGVEVTLTDSNITIKGSKGVLTTNIDDAVAVKITDGAISVLYDRNNKLQNVLAGTVRANIANMVT